MQIKTRALVLRTVKYGESEIIVDLLTEECGRVSLAQRMVKSKRNGIRTQLLQPLTLLDIVFDNRPSAMLQRAREMTLHAPFVSVPFNERKLAIALFVAEFTCYATRKEQKNTPLFQFIADSVMWLDACRGNFANFHIVFMLRLTRFIGFFPNLSHAGDDAFFDMRDGCFIPQQPLHNDFITPGDASKITLLMRLNYSTMHLLAMSHNERNRCVELIIGYYQLHVPNFPHLKSLDVLRELFV